MGRSDKLSCRIYTFPDDHRRWILFLQKLFMLDQRDEKLGVKWEVDLDRSMRNYNRAARKQTGVA